MGPGTASATGVLVTRPRHQAAELAAAVEAAGWHAVLFPVMDIVAVDAADVDAQLDTLHAPDITVFISPNAVRFGADRSTHGRRAAIGPATSKALETAGYAVDIRSPDGFDSEHLLATDAFMRVDDKVIRIVRGRTGRELLADTLRERGAIVEYLAVYERIVPTPTDAELESLESLWMAGGIGAVIIMSVESMENLVALLPSACLPLLARTRLVSAAPRVIKDANIRFPGIPTTLAEGPQAAQLAAALAGRASTTSGHD